MIFTVQSTKHGANSTKHAANSKQHKTQSTKHTTNSKQHTANSTHIYQNIYMKSGFETSTNITTETKMGISNVATEFTKITYFNQSLLNYFFRKAAGS